MANSTKKDAVNPEARNTRRSCVLAAALFFAAAFSASAEVVSFRNDVMAVLAKAGCSAGVCHGNKYGKGGFKLSLRGQDPDADFVTLTREMFARRVDPFEPEKSLLLLKPTTQVMHEGGKRFKRNSEEYELLRKWIVLGMPDDSATAPKLKRIDVTPVRQVLVEPKTEVQLKATAFFENGTTRDITSLAVYEPANNLVKVSHDGLVERDRPGETTVLVRFLQQQAPVRLAFIPARADFKWSVPRATKYTDQQLFVDARL